MLGGIAISMIISTASADEAEQLLGVPNIHPVVRQVIDDAFDDGSSSLANLNHKVAAGDMHPAAAAEEIISSSEGGVMQILKHLGMSAEALRLNSSWQAFDKARLQAKTSQNIHLPKPPKSIQAPALPEQSHAKTTEDSPNIDKKLKQLDRQLAHTIETKPAISHLENNPQREEHVRDVNAKANAPTIHAKKPSVSQPELDNIPTHIGSPSLSAIASKTPNAGTIHPFVDSTLANISAKSARPNTDMGDISAKVSHMDTNISPAVNAAIGNLNPNTNSGDLSQKLASISVDTGDVSPNIGDVSQQVQNAVSGVDPSANPALQQLNNVENQINTAINPSFNPQSKIGDLQQHIAAKINTNDISQKVRAAVDPDKLKKQIEGDIDVSSIRRKSTSSVDVKLDGARDKIKDAMKTAFGTVNSFMQQRVDEKQTAYNQAKSAYDAINVPPIRKHKVCVKHVVVCVSHARVPIPSSVEEHNNALAKQKIAQGNMDAANKELQKYQQGQQQVIQKETDTYSQLDTVFASANTSTSVTTEIDATSEDTATAQDPDSQKKRVPGNNKDDSIVVIADNITENIISIGTITAAIGSDSAATTNIGAIGDISDTRISGDLKQTIIAPGVISAALGYETTADVRIGNTDGTINGRVNRNIKTVGVLAAAIGAQSNAGVSIANIDGTVNGSATQNATIVGALAAAIGGDTSAHIYMGNVASDVKVGTLNQNITQITPAIAAAIGYDSTALITAGQINADITGHATQNITLGSVVAAAIGSHTETKIRIGEVNQKITGDLDQTIHSGAITNIAIGANTSANTDIGVIDAPVTGDVKQNIYTGVITTATVGVGTGAETVVGSIRAPVNGDITQNISVGDITTFSIGLGIGGNADIRARSYVGSVFQPVNGPVNINVSTGSIVSLGFGLDIDLGPLGELRIVESGCEGGSVRLGNIGNPC